MKKTTPFCVKVTIKPLVMDTISLDSLSGLKDSKLHTINTTVVICATLLVAKKGNEINDNGQFSWPLVHGPVCVYQDMKQSGHTAYRWSKKNLLKQSRPRLVKNSNIMHENCFFPLSSTKFSEIWKKSLKLVITKGYRVLVTMIASQNAIAPAKSSAVLCISFMWLNKGFNFVCGAGYLSYY